MTAAVGSRLDRLDAAHPLFGVYTQQPAVRLSGVDTRCLATPSRSLGGPRLRGPTGRPCSIAPLKQHKSGLQASQWRQQMPWLRCHGHDEKARTDHGIAYEELAC
ncbi:hypothetical protein MTO96_013552 [Rhipicephalus appendiculatus]